MTELEKKFEVLKNEVDALQIAVSEKVKPWYLNVPTIISLTALAFSFGTTAVSYKRTTEQDISNTRAELRQVLQRLVELPKEVAISQKTYSSDESLSAVISGLINQENSFLVAQTDGIMKRIPEGVITAGEYYSIGLAYQYSYHLSKAKEYFAKSYDLSAGSLDFNTEIASLRSGASLSFATGELSQGRAAFQKALEIFVRYPSFDQFTKLTTNIYTQISWAASETSFGDESQARRQIETAERFLIDLPSSPQTTQLRSQVASVKAELDQRP